VVDTTHAPSFSRPDEVAELAVDSRCVLGESILWCTQLQILLWTDIQSQRLWIHRPDSGTTRHWSLPDRLGCLALCKSGRVLFGLSKGLFLADPAWDSDDPPVLTTLIPVEVHDPRTRINDGRCDRAGNFVFGTLNESAAQEPIGSFYQYSSQGLLRLNLGGVAIPNSICFSPDGRILYYCDSTQSHIRCCDYDAESGETANSRVFATLPIAGVCPDGSTVDAEGCLWNAQWGASRVVRYTPQGEIDRVVSLPAKKPTCVAFGGAQLKQLYISTARLGSTTEELERLAESGGVYRWASQSRGLPENRVEHL